jgi:hypothetical protein
LGWLDHTDGFTRAAATPLIRWAEDGMAALADTGIAMNTARRAATTAKLLTTSMGFVLDDK